MYALRSGNKPMGVGGRRPGQSCAPVSSVTDRAALDLVHQLPDDLEVHRAPRPALGALQASDAQPSPFDGLGGVLFGTTRAEAARAGLSAW